MPPTLDRQGIIQMDKTKPTVEIMRREVLGNLVHFLYDQGNSALATQSENTICPGQKVTKQIEGNSFGFLGKCITTAGSSRNKEFMPLCILSSPCFQLTPALC